MTSNFANWDDRTLDLAIERFTVGLNEADQAILASLAREEDLLDFERSLAAIHLASLDHLEEPSSELVDSLEAAGREQVRALEPPGGATAEQGGSASPGRAYELRPTSGPGMVSPDNKPRSVMAFAGWLAAAAALILSFVLNQPAPELGVDVLRTQLIDQAPDLVRIAWTATEDPAAKGTTGDVVWSTSAQKGYMHFHSLEPNDPKKAQYQLWIFDPTRADWEAKPVDGGVFDVPTSGDVIVPIDPKLRVSETALFAVTLEVPGGVVVSERERLVVTAAGS